ncbi:hypothetical protein ABPG72_021771 [Tetrahymena utriculariae]
MNNHKLGINEAENKLLLEGFEFSLQELVQKIMEYRDRSNVNLFTKMNSDYIISVMGKDYLQELEKKFVDSGHKTMDILQFIYTFLSLIPHNEEETIFLTLGLIELFKIICENLNMAQEVKFSDITTSICDRVAIQFEDEYKIKTRKYPPERRFTELVEGNHDKAKKIDFRPPLVYENNLHNSLKRLHKGKFKTDSTFHNKQSINHGVFAKEIKKVATLDSLDDKIAIYDLNCNLVKHINLKNKEDDSKLDIIIFGIAWSERQQRIGAVLKNFTISFWDAIDDFEFEKNFSVHGYTQDYQNNIWYLEKHDMWITTDSKNMLYCWNIGEERTNFQLSTSLIQGAIFQVLELPQIGYCAVGSIDKQVTIWDFYKQLLLFQIDVGQVGVHSIAFSNSFQVLLTAGYENNIQLYTIDDEYLDSTLIGKLRGHNSMISCIQVIESTPMVISADDLGVVRLWDIRNQSCIQSYECSNSFALSNSTTKKMNIQLILDMYSEGMVALIGSRINIVNFDEKEEIVKSFNQVENLFAFKVENNTIRDELIVCTRKNIQFYDMNSGICKFTINGLMDNSQDEITVFKQVFQGQKFLLGNQKGQLSLHSYQQNGERIKFLNNHSNEVTQLKIDYVNKLLISGGWDSTIKIQQLSEETVELKRKVENVHNEKGISLLEVSVYHNVIFSATQNLEQIFIYDYEYGRLLNFIEFKKKTEPTALSVIQGYPILIVATSENKIYLIHFQKKENKVKFDLLGVINIEVSEQIFGQIDKYQNANENDLFITKQAEEHENQIQITTQFQIKNEQYQSNPSKRLNQSIAANNSVGLTDIFNPNETQQRVSLQLDQINYIDHPSSGEASTRTENAQNKNNTKYITNEVLEKEQQVSITKILPDFQFNEQNQLTVAKIYCANTKGHLIAFDLERLFKYYDNLQYWPHSNTRMNYNPHRNSNEDFKASFKRLSNPPKRFSEQTQLTDLFQKTQKNHNSDQHISYFINRLIFKNIQAHKDVITSIAFLNGDKNAIMTSGQDYYVKIWETQTLNQLCSLNINHPLPIQWDYKCDHNKKSQKKVLFALRIIDLLNKKYSSDASRKEQNQTKILNFLKKLMGNQSRQRRITYKFDQNNQDKEGANQEQVYELETHQNENKMLLSEYYSPKDIKYEEVKNFYKSELLGPSLKRLEINKRVAIAQQIWKKPKLTKEEEEREKVKKVLDFHVKSDERETIVNFLDPNFRSQVIKQGFHFEDDYSRYTQNLQNKIEFYEYNAIKKANKQLKTQNSGVSVQLQSIAKLQVPQSGKRQNTQSPQQNQMNHTSRPSLLTELSNAEQKIPSVLNLNTQKRMSFLYKNSQTQAQQQTKKRKQSIVLQTENQQKTQIQNNNNNNNNNNPNSSINNLNNQPKFGQNLIIQAQSPIVKEPINFDNLLQKQNNSSQVVHKKNIFFFPDNQETKIRVEAFPQTVAKLQNAFNLSGSEDYDQILLGVQTAYPHNNKSSFGQNSEQKNKKSQDLYKYAQEKQIIGNSNLSTQGQSINSNGSTSQIVSASTNKLHQILSGINQKLMKSKKLGNQNNFSNVLCTTNNGRLQNTKSSLDYEIIKKTEQDPFSQQPSQRSLPKKNIISSIFTKGNLGNNFSTSHNGLKSFNFHGSFHIDKPLNHKKQQNNMTLYPNQANQGMSENNNSFQFSKLSKNRQSLPTIVPKK